MMYKLLRLSWVLLVFFTFWQATTIKPVELSTDVNDKVLHIMAFFVLSAWGCFAWLHRHQQKGVMISLLVLGALIEVVQNFVPGRDASLYDFAGDVLGMFLGYMLIVWIIPKFMSGLYQFFVRIFHHG